MNNQIIKKMIFQVLQIISKRMFKKRRVKLKMTKKFKEI